MTATKHFGWFLFVFTIAAALLVGCGSSGDDTFDANAIPPSITGLSRNAADIGQEVVISGLRFGQTKANSSISLNGMDFEVSDNDWDDRQITVTVGQGMTSGIVVMTVGGVSSQSGPEAQLFIPNAPTGAPLMGAISPDFGTEGTDEVLISGFNFGDGTGNSGVYFPAVGGAVSQTGGVVLAPVVTIDINGEQVTQWSNSTIKVTVPDNSQSGLIYVLVDGEMSNKLPFTVLPKQLTGPPVIFPQSNDPQGINPDFGGANTAVIVSGENFGSKQGSSSIMLNDAPMSVITWTTIEIVALTPNNAESGPIRVTVGGVTAESAPFLVENQPYISGISPSVMRVGQSLTITGQYFGVDQGTGKIKVGSTTVTVDSWSDNQIYVASLPALTYSVADQVPVQVTANSGKSHTAFGSVETPLVVYVLTPNPSQGEAGTTDFNMFVTVVGGSGNYQYTFIPNKSFPSQADLTVNSLPMIHQYSEDDVPVPKDFLTLIKVKDTTTGDEVIVDGPTLSVVPKGQAVVMSMEVENFNYGVAIAPRNDWTYTRVPPLMVDIAYNDFTFFGGQVYYGSALGELEDGGNPVSGVTRDLAAFMTGSPTSRPYGYRYGGSQGSIVRINGLNLGTSGDIYLNSTGVEAGDLGYHVDAADIVPGSWTESSVEFYLPLDVFQNLSGRVAILTGLTSVLSSSNLICSALIRDFQPITPIELDGQFVISGYDLEPPEVADVTGDDTFFIFVVQADFLNPFTGLADSGSAILANPMPADPSGSQVLFDMSTIPAQAQVEVYSLNFDQASFELGTMLAGAWQGFIWTGALTSGSSFVKANSGIFSESFAFMTTGGGGPPGETYSVTGLVSDKSILPVSPPIPGVAIHIINTTGPAYSDDVLTGPDGRYIFTGVPENEEYEVWGDDAAWLWPTPRPIGPVTGDLTFIDIGSNGPS